MQWIGEVWRRLAFFFRRGQFQRDLKEEMDDHVQMKQRDLTDEGMPPGEAHNAARREFGNALLLRETSREAWGYAWLEILLQDLRYGLRQLRRNPGFTAVAIITLALGIGANTTIFSAISAMILRKPPVKDPDSLCAVASTDRRAGADLVWPSAPDFISWQQQNQVFDDMAAIRSGREFTLTGKSEPQAVMGDYVTPGYFKVVGMVPVMGRTFLPSEAEAGSNHVVILSNGLWRERYSSDPKVIGKRLDIDGVPYTIVGVMSRGASISPWDTPDLWTPLAFSSSDLSPSERGDHNITMVLARLKHGVTLRQAQSEMGSVAQRLAKTYPETNKDWGVTVLTLQEYLIRKAQEGTGALVMIVAVGFVLLIACANIAGLLLARGTARSHEWAVRAAVGASRMRLARQMLVESLLIGAGGGAAGLILSVWGIQLLRAGFSFNSYGAEQARLFHLDDRTLLFTLAVSVLSALLFGLAPALRASKVDLGDALSESGRTGSLGLGRSRLRNVLVVAEIALAVVLLAGAGIAMREVIWELLRPVGFNPQHLVIANLHLDGPGYRKAAARIALFEGVTERVRNLPGVENAGLDNCVPLGCGYSTSLTIMGQRPAIGSGEPSADYFVVGPGYFRAMQIPLRKGREFGPSDNANAPVVAVVSQEFARRYFPKGDAIGQRIKAATLDAKPAQIVGIVGDVSEYVGQMRASPQLYECDLQFPFTAFSGTSLFVRSQISLSALAPALRHAIRSADKDQPVTTILTMKDIVADNVGGDKFMAGLMGTFAALALLLAAVGIYGVITYLVTQRTREIGIRVALGARKKDVLGLVLKQGGLLSGIGCAIGFGLALPLPRILAGLFNGFPPQGPLVAIAVALIVALVSLLATYLPARRAAKVDPMVALRYE